MHAHGHDLQLEVDDVELVEQVKEDWRKAPLPQRERALCEAAEKISLRPAELSERDLDPLRSVGLDDAAILDLVQVASYFNYINRVADGPGVDLEPFMPPDKRSSG